MSIPPDGPGPRPRLRQALASATLLFAAAGAVFFQVKRTAEPGAAQAVAETVEKKRSQEQIALDAFLTREAAKLLNETHRKDMAAVQRALDALRGNFQSYAQGIPAFTDALTGWGMRMKIVYRSSVETLERKDTHYWTASLVQQKFDEHVLSDERLEKDVMGVMKQFAYELEANRNEMLVNLEVSLHAADLPATARQLALNGFRERTRQRIRDLLAGMPGQSVGVGVGSLAAGIVAEEAVRQLIRAVIAQAATRIAAGAAVSGGAAAGAAATGGAGGSVVAPGVGTAIGLAGGLIVGAVVDWWLTDEFKEKVAAECRRFLSSTEVALMTGDRGLEKLLLDHVNASRDASRRAVSHTLAAAAAADSTNTLP